jgi:ATP-dependent DNA helicase 2 subunit 2
VKQALFHAAIVNDLATNPLPPPHPELEKFFKPPNRVLKRTHEALEECKTAFKVTHGKYLLTSVFVSLIQFRLVAPKITAKKKEVGLAQVDEENIPLHIEGAPILPKPLPPAIAGLPRPQDSGATQSGGDEYEAFHDLGDATQESPHQTGPSHAQEPSPLSAAFEQGIAPGRIIGSVVPLQDFKRNLSVGDLVTKAVEDICLVLQEEIVKPMANRRKDEFLECLQYLRETCLKVRII